MNILPKVGFVLAIVLWPGSISVASEISNSGHYSQTIVNTVLDIYPSNTSSRRRASMDKDDVALHPHIYPYILLALWVICISSIICCCLYCKCQQAELMTAYNSNSFELQEVHVLDHPLPHVKGCVCLACLQRQVAKELQRKSDS